MLILAVISLWVLCGALIYLRMQMYVLDEGLKHIKEKIAMTNDHLKTLEQWKRANDIAQDLATIIEKQERYIAELESKNAS